jgi:DNA (cytosine-5)-methyltransferase 1
MEKRFAYRKSIGRKGVSAGCLAEQVEWSGMGEPINYITKDKFPTPQASDWKNKNHSRDYTLGNVKYIWPTPKCSDSRHAITRHLKGEGIWQNNLGEVIMSLEAQNIGRLNPTWVEWLMGWPLGWTDLKPQVMDKFPCAQPQRGIS